MEEKENKEEVGSAPSSSSVAVIAEQEPKSLLDLSPFKEATPRPFTNGFKSLECGVCKHRLSLEAPTEEEPDNPINGDPRHTHMLCNTHYAAAYFGTDVTARAKVEAAISDRVPRAYESAEFSTFKVAGYSDGSNLREVRETVKKWAYNHFFIWYFGHGVNDSSTSLYLYGDQNGTNTGNGCGKTHLAWAAYKYIARRTAAMPIDHCDSHGNPLPRFRCTFTSIQKIVDYFRTMESKEQKCYVFYDGDGKRQSGTFDDYVVNIGWTPFLFIDDVGSERYFIKSGDPSMEATTLEKIVAIRADNSLPTFFTSNYGPNELADRVGSRAASRVFRADCQAIRVTAPDYMLAKSKGKATFKLMN